MSRNNFILAVGDKDSEDMRVIKETLNSCNWGYYDAAESGKKATDLYLSNDYKLVVTTGGFGWEEYAEPCPIQSLVLVCYMRMWYKSENMPTVIVYEPEENKRQRLYETREKEMEKWVTIIGSREELFAELDRWWYDQN